MESTYTYKRTRRKTVHMNETVIVEERERVVAEIEALERWYEDLMRYVENGLRDPSVSREEFTNAATMITRVLMRLKALNDRAGEG